MARKRTYRDNAPTLREQFRPTRAEAEAIAVALARQAVAVWWADAAGARAERGRIDETLGCIRRRTGRMSEALAEVENRIGMHLHERTLAAMDAGLPLDLSCWRRA